eukprot:10733019-Heterocapsa_arctica.AAC.1
MASEHAGRWRCPEPQREGGNGLGARPEPHAACHPGVHQAEVVADPVDFPEARLVLQTLKPPSRSSEAAVE